MTNNPVNIKRNAFNIITAFIVLLAFFVHYPTFRGDFVYDDYPVVVENTYVEDLSLKSAASIFSNFIYANYAPVTFLSLSIDKTIFGDNPAGFHFVSLLLHSLNVLLIIILARKLFDDKLAALIAGAIYAVHPLCVEPAAWISSRKDLLYVFFSLVSLIFYLKYLNRKNLSYLTAVFILFVLAVLSKAPAVVLPAIYLLVDYFRGRRFDKRLWLEKAPFIVVSIAMGIIAIIAQGEAGALRIKESYGFLERAALSFYGLVFYLFKFIVPTKLSANYPFPEQTGGFDFWIYSSPVIAVVLAFLAYKAGKRNKIVAFSALFYFFALIPYLQVLAVGNAFAADRFAYFAIAPLCFLAGWGLSKFYTSEVAKRRKVGSAVLPLIIVVAAIFSYISYNRSEVWENQITLFSDVSEKYPALAFPYNNMGLEYFEKRENHEKAIEMFKKAIERDKDFSFAYNNLGNVYDEIGENRKALDAYLSSIKADSTNAAAHNNAGLQYYKMNEYEKAERHFRIALKLNGNNVSALNNYANLLIAKSEYVEAVEKLRKSLNISPNNPITYVNLAGAFFEMGDEEKAKEYLNKSLKINPNNEKARKYLKLIRQAEVKGKGASGNDFDKYFESGNRNLADKNFEKAVESYRKALEAKPLAGGVYVNLGIALASLRKNEEAIKAFKQAIEINSENVTAYKNLALVYYRTGNEKKTIQCYVKAARLGDEAAQNWLRQNGIDWK